MKKTAGFLIALSLVGAGLATPAQASDAEPPRVSLLEQADPEISQFIVKYETRVSAVQADGQPTGNDIVDVDLDFGNSIGSGMRTVTLDTPISLDEAKIIASELTADPRIKFAEPDVPVHAFENVVASALPTEYWYQHGDLWGLNGTYGVSAPGAWVNTQGSASVIVGVIDTGYTVHSELDANRIAGYDFISDKNSSRDGGGYDSDPKDEGDWTTTSSSSWHGTHVEGIINAAQNNGGVVGTAPDVKVMPIRALGKLGGTTADIISAITWGSGGFVGTIAPPPNKADVLNLSLGGSGSCPVDVQTAITNAISRGTVVVVAAGNEDQDVANVFPANCNGVITVAAVAKDGKRGWYTDSTGQPVAFSNYGRTGTASASMVSIAAPGVDIYGTWNAGKTTPGSQAYASMTGTSMATPFVSGVIALMKSAKSSLTVNEIKNLIRNPLYVTGFSGGACDSDTNLSCGVGIINAEKLIAAVLPAPTPAPTETPVQTDPTQAAPETAAVVDTPPVTDTPPAGDTPPSSGDTPAVETPTSSTPAAAPLTYAAKKRVAAKTFAKKAGVTYTKKSTVSLKVLAGKSACKIKSGKLATLKAGSCLVAVKVTTKVKVGKKYKNKSTTTKVNMLVA